MSVFQQIIFLHMSAMIGNMEILKLTVICQTEMPANVFVGAVDLATAFNIWIFFLLPNLNIKKQIAPCVCISMCLKYL